MFRVEMGAILLKVINVDEEFINFQIMKFHCPLNILTIAQVITFYDGKWRKVSYWKMSETFLDVSIFDRIQFQVET